MPISRANGWTVDTDAKTISWSGSATHTAKSPLPDATLGAFIYFGMGYLESQAAARTVNDKFRKAWLEEARKANPNVKAKDAPKDVVPPSDSDEYRTALLEAHTALYEKFLSGYEVGVRDAASDPVAEAADKVARDWLQGLATQFMHEGKPWFTLPKGKKVAKDEDLYDGPKYDTFGEALASFKVSTSPAKGKLVSKTADGKPWPFKMAQNLTVAQAIAVEAERIVAERTVKAPVKVDAEDVGADVF